MPPYAGQPVGKVLRLYTQNRSAWDEHVQTLRVAVVGTLFDLPLTPVAVSTYVATGTKVANALSGYVPQAFVTQLQSLMQGHVQGTLKIVEATKKDDKPALDAALKAGVENGQQIAMLLSQMTGTPFTQTNELMQGHIKAAVDDLNQAKAANWPGEDSAYKHMREHALMMADQISNAVVSNLPKKYTLIV